MFIEKIIGKMDSDEIIPIMSGDATFKERNKILTSGSFKLIVGVRSSPNNQIIQLQVHLEIGI